MSAFSIKRTLELIVLNVCFPAKADIQQVIYLSPVWRILSIRIPFCQHQGNIHRMKPIDEFRRKYGGQKFPYSIQLFNALSREPNIYISGPDRLDSSIVAQTWRRRAKVLEPKTIDDLDRMHETYLAMVKAIEESPDDFGDLGPDTTYDLITIDEQDRKDRIHDNYMTLVNALEASPDDYCHSWIFWTSSAETFDVFVSESSDTVLGCILGEALGPPPEK